jgi:hypothetical protein
MAPGTFTQEQVAQLRADPDLRVDLVPTQANPEGKAEQGKAEPSKKAAK